MSSCRSVPEDNDRDVSIHSLSAIKDPLTEWLARLDGYACAMSTRNKAAKASEMSCCHGGFSIQSVRFAQQRDREPFPSRKLDINESRYPSARARSTYDEI